MSRAHELFDKYVANPLGELAFAVGGLALVGVAVDEIVDITSGSEVMNTGSLFEVIAPTAGAALLGFVAITAGNHYRGPNHIPPQRER